MFGFQTLVQCLVDRIGWARCRCSMLRRTLFHAEENLLHSDENLLIAMTRTRRGRGTKILCPREREIGDESERERNKRGTENDKLTYHFKNDV